MTTIYKYTLGPGRTRLYIPRGADLLTVQTANSAARLWAKVDPSQTLELRTFITYGTGSILPSDKILAYVGTYQTDGGALVWHVFEAPNDL